MLDTWNKLIWIATRPAVESLATERSNLDEKYAVHVMLGAWRRSRVIMGGDESGRAQFFKMKCDGMEYFVRWITIILLHVYQAPTDVYISSIPSVVTWQ